MNPDWQKIITTQDNRNPPKQLTAEIWDKLRVKK